VKRPPDEDDDQTPWEAPGPQGFLRGPFEDDGTEWPPERLGDDRQSRLARRTLFFVIVLGILALVPVIGLLLRLRR
jgi:hypothetical protein